MLNSLKEKFCKFLRERFSHPKEFKMKKKVASLEKNRQTHSRQAAGGRGRRQRGGSSAAAQQSLYRVRIRIWQSRLRAAGH